MPIIVHTWRFSFQIRKAAVDIVRGLTGSVEGLQSLANYSNALLPALSRLLTLPKVRRILLVWYYYRFYLCWDGVSFFQEVSEAAAEALVNLSQNSSALIKLEELYTNWSTCSVVRVYENTIKESESEQEFITCGDGEERKETSSSISVAILRLLPTLLCSARLCGRRRLLPQISHC